jgi:hypothetical protein
MHILHNLFPYIWSDVQKLTYSEKERSGWVLQLRDLAEGCV